MCRRRVVGIDGLAYKIGALIRCHVGSSQGDNGNRACVERRAVERLLNGAVASGRAQHGSNVGRPPIVTMIRALNQSIFTGSLQPPSPQITKGKLSALEQVVSAQ